MSTVFLGMGSNIGNREKHCQKALELLREYGLNVVKQSSLHETEPWGNKEQPKFLNMAVEIETSLSPRALLGVLKKIEDDMGREIADKWGPRIIDLDILLYDDIILNEMDIVIPHPYMHEREFVLRPLSEIASDKLHPVLKKRVGDLLLCLN
jgi:2-amino-4-hydroxy-6-hydroxymethyldihydropteridine diphosphokinase